MREPGGYARQFVIEQRTAHFERVSHRHPVHLHEHVFLSIGRGFPILCAAQRIGRGMPKQRLEEAGEVCIAAGSM